LETNRKGGQTHGRIQGGENAELYVDAVGFQEVPNFLKGLQKPKERGEAR